MIEMKTRLLIPVLCIFFAMTIIPATAQENNCVEMDVEIESTASMDWTTCYIEEYASLLIKTSSEQSTDIEIVLQKDVFWNYDVDCSPTRFFTLVNGEEIYQHEEYFEDYRILSVPLEKGDHEIEIIIATIPGMTANETCPNLEDKLLESPLKQFRSGISIDEIQCKESLILVIKNNGSPACVTPETRQNLIDRGWAKYDAMLQKVFDLCSCQESGGPCINPIFKWGNETHHIDSVSCKWTEIENEN